MTKVDFEVRPKPDPSVRLMAWGYMVISSAAVVGWVAVGIKMIAF